MQGASGHKGGSPPVDSQMHAHAYKVDDLLGANAKRDRNSSGSQVASASAQGTAERPQSASAGSGDNGEVRAGSAKLIICIQQL